MGWTACGEAAAGDKEARFAALLQHVTVHRLMLASGDLKKGAAPGVDGVTWHEYEQDLHENVRGLHARVQSGRYRAKPPGRVYIPKADGRQRPLTIAASGSAVLIAARIAPCSRSLLVSARAPRTAMPVTAVRAQLGVQAAGGAPA